MNPKTSMDAIAGAFLRAPKRRYQLDKMKRFSDPSTKYILPPPDFNATQSESRVYTSDKRLARLMLVLRELDESLAKFEELSQSELSEIVFNAILACGFAEGTEAQYAIGAVLEAIERRDPLLGGP
jgi:hypothetical protein